MTSPDGFAPSGALGPVNAGSLQDSTTLTEADIYDTSKAATVGTDGSYTNVQTAVASEDGNVIASGSSLWQTFARNADATFPRILLTPEYVATASAGSQSCAATAHSHGGHTHSLTTSPPDYQPSGNGANRVELGYIEVSKDRSYTQISFGTGDSVTALGLTAMYLGAYMQDDNGNLTLMAATSNIASSVANTNTEYTYSISSVDALKGEIWAIGILQVTSITQTCKSILGKTIWSMSAPSGFKPDALYGYASGGSSLPSSISYGSITYDPSFVPYYALS